MGRHNFCYTIRYGKMPAMTLLLQIFGLVLLVTGIGFGYWRWIKPQGDSLDFQGKGLLLLVILMVMGGFVGSPFWWLDEALSFSWDLPLLASRMLAAAGWSFVVVAFVILEHPTYRRLRLALLLLFVYLIPLAVAAPLFHANRFDPAAPITYAFFAIVLLMVVATTWYLLRQPRIFPDQLQDLVSPSRGVRLWLVIIAIVTVLWGLALIVTDDGPSTLIWVWPGDLLTSRLIGVMLLTIAAGAIYSLPARGTARPMLAMILTYGLGLSLASLSIPHCQLTHKSFLPLWVGRAAASQCRRKNMSCPICRLTSTAMVVPTWPLALRGAPLSKPAPFISAMAALRTGGCSPMDRFGMRIRPVC